MWGAGRADVAQGLGAKHTKDGRFVTGSDFAAQIESVPPSKLEARYGTLLQLGAGGMALVHLAIDRSRKEADELVVLKSIRPDLTEDERIVTMFLDEARICMRLEHANVVETREVLRVNSLPIMVMEYLEGQSFAECINAAVPPLIRLHVILEILSGLDYAHGLMEPDGRPLGIIHRDITPQNVIATYDGRVKLLDFGIAKAAGQATRTETGEIKGKLRYMAPEQMIATGVIDRRADIFSVGIMLWETLTQRRLWTGVSDVEVVETVLDVGVPAPSRFTSDIEPALENVCMKAVDGDPNRRYASALAMQEALANVMESLGYAATPNDLASWLQVRFAGQRSRMQAMIASRLKHERARNHPVRRGPGFSTLPNLEMPWPVERVVPPSPVGASVPRPRPTRRVALAAGALVAAVGIGVAIRPVFPDRLLHSELGVASVAEAGPAPSASEGARAARSLPLPLSTPSKTLVEVSLFAKPKSARLFLDGLEVSNPYVAKRPADGSAHSVRAEARGYVPKSLDVVFGERPVSLSIVLEVPAGAGAGARARKAPAPVPAPRSDERPAASGSSDCDSPFTVDSDGIRHVRPECLR